MTFVVIGTLGFSWYKWGMMDDAFPILIEQTQSNQSDLLYTNFVGSLLFSENPFADYSWAVMCLAIDACLTAIQGLQVLSRPGPILSWRLIMK